MKYRKRPEIIEALQLRWDTWSEMRDFLKVGKLSDGKPEGKMDNLQIGLDIPTSEGVMRASENDYVWKDLADELHVSKPNIFEKTYEKIPKGCPGVE